MTTVQNAALILRLMPAVEAGMHAADDLTLAHEAERLEAQQDSPVIAQLRRIVANEQAVRSAKKVAQGRPDVGLCCIGYAPCERRSGCSAAEPNRADGESGAV